MAVIIRTAAPLLAMLLVAFATTTATAAAQQHFPCTFQGIDLRRIRNATLPLWISPYPSGESKLFEWSFSLCAPATVSGCSDRRESSGYVVAWETDGYGDRKCERGFDTEVDGWYANAYNNPEAKFRRGYDSIIVTLQCDHAAGDGLAPQGNVSSVKWQGRTDFQVVLGTKVVCTW